MELNNLNKNKIIFIVIGIVILLLVIMLIIVLSSRKNGQNAGSSKEKITIWMVGEKTFDYNKLITTFKETYTKYKNSSITFQIFPNYEDYTYTLASAINSGVGPDIFVLNNNENFSIFSNQIMRIPNSLVSPNDFRKRFKLFFTDDLVESYTDENKASEHLIGIPVGYEVLGIYYNFQRVKRSDLDNLSSLNNTIASLKQKNNGIIPLGIGNGTTVYDATDIATQFLVSSGVNGISGISLKKGLADYLSYGDTTGINGYNARFSELKNDNKTSLHLFSRGEIYMVIGYPSLINRIKDAGGYSKNLLQVAPFPHSLVGGGNTLVNYNYFTINKSTSNLGLAQNFLAYLATDAGEQKFLDSYPYYLPALVSLETEEMSEKLINSDFNITLGDFYNEKVELVSFDKGIRDIYDKEITLLLDNAFQQEQSYTKLKDTIMCKLDKIKNFENLSEKCE